MLKPLLRSLIQVVAVLLALVGAFSLTINDYQLLPEMERRRVTARLPLRASQKESGTVCLGETLSRVVEREAASQGLDPKLLLAVIHVESNCNSHATSLRGAVGLMQILPSTARGLGFSNPHHPEDNIRAGALYLKLLHDQFGKDVRLALAAYNAGPSAVRRYRGVPPYSETERYVQSVLKKYSQLREI